MRKVTVFIDGQSGTTGLMIHERLEHHPNVEILTIPAEQRRDTGLRKQYINEAEFVFLCLPDDAARESVALVEVGNDKTRVIDASTAHRVQEGWVYGLPELSPQQREDIRRAHRLAVPGCYATCFILAVAPLVRAGYIGADYPVVVNSVTGYSGGGKSMIAEYEDADRRDCFITSRYYGLTMKHKHIPEMTQYAGLSHAPIFNPILGDYYKGMALALPLHTRMMKAGATPQQVHALYEKTYAGQRFVKVIPFGEDVTDDGKLDPMALNDTNEADIMVSGHEEQIMVIVRLDNLGKGSSGAAVQCMNIMLDIDEATGL